MFKWFHRLVRLAILLVVIALIFDFHYKGRSSRDYALEYGKKAFTYLYGRAKALMGKDLEEITPKSISEVPEKLKELAGANEKKADTPPSSKEKDSSSSKGDDLTDEDRAALKKLLEEKSQTK
jgi:hypothetical protein